MNEFQNGPEPGRRRRKLVLTPAGVVVLLALMAVMVSLLVSTLGGGGQAGTPTLTSASPGPGLTPVVITRVPAETPAAADLSPEEFSRWLDRAEGLALESRFAEAIAIYQDLARRAPDDWRVPARWAWALLLDGQGEEALVHARHAVELAPVRSETTAALAAAYLATGDGSRAVAMAESAVQLGARSALAHAVLAEAYLDAGRAQEAAAEADVALERDAASAAAHHVRGRIYQEVEGDPGQAVRELQAAVRAEPGVWRWHHELGLALLRSGDPDGAVAAFQQSQALRAKAPTYTALAEAYYRLGQVDAVMPVLEVALALGADDPQTAGLMAAALANLGRCVDARAYYQQALATAPEEPRALEAQGRCEGTEVPPAVPGATPRTTPPVLAGSPAPATPPAATAASAPVPSLAGWIAFPVWNGTTGAYDTYLSRTDGSDRRLVAGQAHQPAFRPDGAWLAVNSEQPLQENLLLVPPDGGQTLEITQHTEDGQPAWSPDGKSLAFSSTRHGDRQSRIYVLDPVPLDGSKAQGWPLLSGGDDARGDFPAWTGDGRIVYSGCDYTVAPSQCGLLALPAEPGPQTPQRLTDHPGDTAPAVHGDQVALMSDRDGNWEIYRVSLDGSGLQRLTDGPAVDALPVWSPDGRWIAFVSDEGGRWALWAMRPDGTGRRQLFEVGGAGLGSDWQGQRISWGP